MIQATSYQELRAMEAAAEGKYPPLNHGQLFNELEDLINISNEQKRAIIIDALWKFVRNDYHGVMDCAADLRELHL